MKAWIALGVACSLTGCANPVARHYVATEAVNSREHVEPIAAPEVRATGDLPREERKLHEAGWVKIGSAEFSGLSQLNLGDVQAHARRVGAQVAIWTERSKRRESEGFKVRHHEPQSEGFDRLSSSAAPTTRTVESNVPSVAFREYFYEISFWRSRLAPARPPQ